MQPTPFRSAIFVAALAFATSALAQVPPPSDAEKSRMKRTDLAPHAPKMTVTPVDQIPVGELKVPPGFKVEVWASGMPGVRMMTRGDRGTIFAGTRIIGRVYAITDRGDRRESRVIAEKLTQPNGVAFKDGSLYVAAINRVLRYDDIELNLANVPEPKDLTAAFNLPREQHHGWKFMTFGPDGKLYIPVGVPCNFCDVDHTRHGIIRRFNADGSGSEIVARGVRNTVGFDFHPQTRELWFTDNGRDWQGEEGPEDELNRVPRNMKAAHFGNPYCHANGIVDADLPKAKEGDACKGTLKPVALMGPHTAALGMRFYTGDMFPAAYRDSIFVARRGSWNKTEKSGYDVVNVKVSADGRSATVTPFLTGFLKDNQFWGRPVDVLQMPDGSLLVAEEQLGAILRISYTGRK